MHIRPDVFTRSIVPGDAGFLRQADQQRNLHAVPGWSTADPVDETWTDDDRPDALCLEGEDLFVQRDPRGAPGRRDDRCVLVENGIGALSGRLRPDDAGAAGVNIRFA